MKKINRYACSVCGFPTTGFWRCGMQTVSLCTRCFDRAFRPPSPSKQNDADWNDGLTQSMLPYAINDRDLPDTE